MARTRANLNRVLCVGVVASAFVFGAVIPAAAGPMFGNRSRDSQSTTEKSSEARSRSAPVDRSRGNASTATESRTRPAVGAETRSRPAAAAETRNRPNISVESRSSSRTSTSNSIWDRLRNGQPSRARSAPAPSASNSERRGDVFTTRDRQSNTNVFQSRESRDSNRSTESRSYSYSGSRTVTDRSKLFERTAERPQTRIVRRDPQHYVTYRSYYDGFYYRPYVGWRTPRYYSGVYYYSWPHRIEPLYFGHYVFGYVRDYCYPSVYFHFGYFPYIHRSRAIIVNVPVVRYVEVPVRVNYRYDDAYYLSSPSRGSIDFALGEIRLAWMRGNWDLLRDYIRLDDHIHVYVDDRYSYTIEGHDYAAMTRDALGRIDTIDIEFYSVKRQGSNRYKAYGKHTYYDVDGRKKSVYVSYTLERSRNEWIITEAGSSGSRLGR